ncbi:serine hydrolase domain-containing protein [Peristeroidobacter soli]|jgi:CubicO group peptidase (beta-lactamase class C family)|uniref:serine hydrolase domain-containing protein n=1 Tax=Peristeroidobacter soli TaxID=2497877 RepID=UPI00101D0156|nr:serine hydrolase domain-containing protein [Peristeroidobacter soli]
MQNFRCLAGIVALVLSSVAVADAPSPNFPATYKFKQNAEANAVFAKFDSTTSPGCAAAVAKDGKLIYSRGYGMANLDHGVPITTQTPFHVASVSKQFTAASVILLAQDGKLSLDDDVRKYLPEVPDFGAPITLRQMIHHTSGLRDQWDLLGLAGWRYSKDRISDDDVLRLVARQRQLNFEPGSQFLYSNMGYTLLALVVKKVSGQSLREFTTARIFKPLGMNNSHFRDDHAEIITGFANGYDRAGDSFKTNVTNFDTTGATSLITTPEDLLLWDENFYTGKVGGKAFIDQMLERGKLNSGETITYASAVGYGEYRGLTTVSHGGSDAGYRSTVRRYPQQHVGIAVTCNIAEARPDELANGLSDVFLSAELKPKDQDPKEFKPNVKSVRAKAGVYLNPVTGRVLRLVEKEGKLQRVDDDGSTQPMFAVSENRFSAGPSSTVVFDFSGTGEQRVITSKSGDEKPGVFQVVPEFTPSAAELNGYTGSFASDELDLRYRVELKDGKLYVATLKQNPLPLLPVTKDVFSSDELDNVTFVRDAGGAITGLKVTSSRARNNEFAKLQ